MIGTLPPLRAISSYCEGLAVALAALTEVEFFSFKALYPKRLYPGHSQEDPEAPVPQADRLRIRRSLTWYNPFSWAMAGRRLNGQVVNLQWWSLPLAPVFLTIALVARLRGIPVVTTLHNVEPHHGQSVLYHWISGLLCALSDKVVVHSAANAHQLQRLHRLQDDKIVRLPMGTADFRRGRTIDRMRARAALSLPLEGRIILMFGAVREYKGIDQVLAALPRVLQDHPDTLLLIAGQPWNQGDDYTQRVASAGLTDAVRLDLRYIPEPEIHNYYSAADVLLLPYKRFSAQSGAGVSALPYGLPILVTNTGSLPDLVRDPQSILTPGDSQALARRIVEILASPALMRKLSADSSFLATQHSWPVIAARHCQEFAALLTQRVAKSL